MTPNISAEPFITSQVGKLGDDFGCTHDVSAPGEGTSFASVKGGPDCEKEELPIAIQIMAGISKQKQIRTTFESDEGFMMSDA